MILFHFIFTAECSHSVFFVFLNFISLFARDDPNQVVATEHFYLLLNSYGLGKVKEGIKK